MPAFMSHDAAPVDLAVPDEAAERIDGPAVAGRHDVDVAVQVHDGGPGPPRAAADDVHARIARRVLGPAFGGEVFDVERRAREVVAEKARALLVRLARRIDGRDADEIGRELDDLVDRAVDFGDHAVGDARCHCPNSYRSPNWISRPF